VKITDDRDDSLEQALTQDNDKLFATKKISKYFLFHLPKSIFMSVEPSVSTATSSLEQELLNLISLLEEVRLWYVKILGCILTWTPAEIFRLQKNLLTGHCITGFDINQACDLEGLKNSIREMANHRHLRMMERRSTLYTVYDHFDICEMLLFASKNNFKLTVIIKTSSKAFSDWPLPKVCRLCGISNDPNPYIDIFPI
jgi:hypothetical protein